MIDIKSPPVQMSAEIHLLVDQIKSSRSLDGYNLISDLIRSVCEQMMDVVVEAGKQ